jgi:hypothetical protein
MAFHTPLTKTENIVLGRGICYFAPFDAAGVPMGERDLGQVESLSLTIEQQVESYYSKRTAVATKLVEYVTQTDFAGEFVVADMSADNIAMFLAGSRSTVTQSATPIANERIYNAESGREFQLGALSGSPAGARNVSSVSVKLYELVNASARADTTAYAVGDIYKSTTNVFLVTTAGTSAGSAPSFNTTAVGDATTDGTAVVKFLGTTAAFTVTTHYLLSAEAARVGIVAGANLALACDLYTEVTGDYLSLNVDYTPAAESRDRMVTSGGGSITGQFRHVADNSIGTNRDTFISSCKLSTNGQIPLIGDGTAAVTMRLGVNELDSSTPHILVEGRSV